MRLFQQHQVWLLICDNDVIDMSEALHRSYSVQEFIEHRVDLPGVTSITVRPNERIASWQTPAAFEHQFELIWGDRVAAIAQAVQDVKRLLRALHSDDEEITPTNVLRHAANLLRCVEQLLIEPEGRRLLTSPEFSNALTWLSDIVGNAYCTGKNFVDCTAVRTSCSIPDAQAVRNLVAHPFRRHFLAPADVRLGESFDPFNSSNEPAPSNCASEMR